MALPLRMNLPAAKDPAWVFNTPARVALWREVFGPANSDAGYIPVWLGAAYVRKPAKAWTGAEWVIKPAKDWTGAAWSPT